MTWTLFWQVLILLNFSSFWTYIIIATLKKPNVLNVTRPVSNGRN